MDTTTLAPPQIAGLVLAGGRGRRMGGQDKGLIELAGRPMVQWVMERLAPQVGELMISANRHPTAYGVFGYPVLSDTIVGFCGPLAGIHAGLVHSRCDYLLVVPCDGPDLPADLALRLALGLKDSGCSLAVCNDGTRLQPTYALLERKPLLPLVEAFLHGGERRLMEWLRRTPHVEVDFSSSPQAFANVNTPEALAELEASLSANRQAAPEGYRSAPVTP